MSYNLKSPLGYLPIGWHLKKLSDVTIKIGSGSTPRGGESAYIDERIEYAFLRSQNVLDFEFNPEGVKFINNDDAAKLKGVHLRQDDVLLNITGDGDTFSRCCILPAEILPAAVNQHVSIIRLDQGKCLPGYLLAYLCLPEIKEYIASFNAGGSRRAITKAHIESFEIPIAPIKEQERIQSLVFNFILKIKMNATINQTLEQMAQALFKSWFVDFEPVKAKIAVLEVGGSQEDATFAAMTAISGKDADALAVFEREHPEQCAELKATAELFPSAMQESELGEIPEGWRTENVENIINRLKVKNTFPADCIKQFGQHPVLEQGAKIYQGYHDEEPSFNASLQSPMFIFGDHTCVMHLSTVPFDISKNTLVLKGKGFNTYWTFFALKGKQKFQEYKRHWSDLKVKQVVIPDESNGFLLTKYFASKCESLFGLLEQNRKQNMNLQNIRDTLLPKLLSGEITLPEAEQAVSEAENV